MTGLTNRIVRRPRGVTALSCFFAFGTTMAGIAAISLLAPGSILEPIWRLNPDARAGFVTIGGAAPGLMLLVAAACAVAAVGLWWVRPWGYWTALAVLTINAIGDLLNAVFRDPRTGIGVPIAALIIVYLVRTRRLFAL